MSVDDLGGAQQQPMSAIGGDSLNSWRWRRLYLFGNALLSWATVAYVLYTRMSTGPSDTAMTMAFGYLVTSSGAYVFGAAWETNRARTILGQAGTAASLGVPVPPQPPVKQTVVVADRRAGQSPGGSATTTTTTTVQSPPTGDDPLVAGKS